MDAVALNDFPDVIYAIEAPASGDVYVAGPRRGVSSLFVLGPDGRAKSVTPLPYDVLELVHDDQSGSFWTLDRNNALHCTDRSGNSTVQRVRDVAKVVPIADGRAFVLTESPHVTPPRDVSFAIVRCGAPDPVKTTLLEDGTYVRGPVGDGRGGVFAMLSRFEGKPSWSVVHMGPDGLANAFASKDSAPPPFKDKAGVRVTSIGTDDQSAIRSVADPLADGAGGVWLATSTAGIVRVALDGSVSTVTKTLPILGSVDAGFKGWALSRESRRPILLVKSETGGYSLKALQEDGGFSSVEVPRDLVKQVGMNDVAWIAQMNGGVLLYGTEGLLRYQTASRSWAAWISSATVTEQKRIYEAHDGEGGVRLQPILGFVSGLAAVSAGGGSLASSANGEPLGRTMTESAVGGVLGAYPTTLIVGGAIGLSYSLGESGALASMGSTFSTMALAMGLIVGPPITALGVYGTGELVFDGSKDNAVLGTFAGAYVGAAAAVTISVLLRPLWKSPEFWLPVLVGVASGLVSSGATLGYHLASGGPSN